MLKSETLTADLGRLIHHYRRLNLLRLSLHPGEERTWIDIVHGSRNEAQPIYYSLIKDISFTDRADRAASVRQTVHDEFSVDARSTAGCYRDTRLRRGEWEWERPVAKRP